MRINYTCKKCGQIIPKKDIDEFQDGLKCGGDPEWDCIPAWCGDCAEKCSAGSAEPYDEIQEKNPVKSYLADIKYNVDLLLADKDFMENFEDSEHVVTELEKARKILCNVWDYIGERK